MSGTDDAGSSAAENLKAVLKKHVKRVTWTHSTNAVYDAAGTNARRISRMCQKESWIGGLVKILFEGNDRMLSRRCRRVSGWSGGARSLFLLHRVVKVHSRGLSGLRLLTTLLGTLLPQGSLSCLQGALGHVLEAWPYSRRTSLGPSVKSRRAPVSNCFALPTLLFLQPLTITG